MLACCCTLSNEEATSWAAAAAAAAVPAGGGGGGGGTAATAWARIDTRGGSSTKAWLGSNAASARSEGSRRRILRWLSRRLRNRRRLQQHDGGGAMAAPVSWFVGLELDGWMGRAERASIDRPCVRCSVVVRVCSGWGVGGTDLVSCFDSLEVVRLKKRRQRQGQQPLDLRDAHTNGPQPARSHDQPPRARLDAPI